MGRRVAVLVAVAAVVVVSVTTAVAVTATDGGEPWTGHRHSQMSAPAPGGQGPAWMMSGRQRQKSLVFSM